jgi:nicotinate-nucleotide adenylyltransferase
MYPGDQLVYLMGGDSLADLPRWENPALLLEHCSQLGVMHRAGADINLDALEQQVPGVKSKLNWVEAPIIEISGSMLRERFKNNLPVRYYLPGEVYRIILDRNLYQADNKI